MPAAAASGFAGVERWQLASQFVALEPFPGCYHYATRFAVVGDAVSWCIFQSERHVAMGVALF